MYMNIINKILTIRLFTEMIYHSTIFFALSLIASVMVGPYIISRQGLLVPLAILSLFTLITKVTSLAIAYLDHLTLQQTSKAMVIQEWAVTMSFLIIPFNPEVFIYVFLSLQIIGSSIYSLFGINYDDYISRGAKGEFKKIQVMERTLFAVAGLAGSGIATLLYFANDYAAVIVSFMLHIVASVYCTYNYKNHWSQVKE